MYVEKYGSGERAYFGLHGWGGDRRTFAPLVERMPEGHEFYSADLPGYGRSPAPREWSLAAIAEEVAIAISSIDAEKVTLVGNCSGAIICLLAADHLNARLARLVLIDPFAFMPWYFKIFVAGQFGRVAYYSTFANPLGRWATNLALKRRRTSRTNLTHSFGAIDHEVSRRYLRLLSEVEGPARFGGINVPVDIVYGEKTFGAIKQSARLWRGVWPHARCSELRGAGHLPIIEATEQLGEIIFTPERVSGSGSRARGSSGGETLRAVGCGDAGPVA
ncbi:MAG TPA: alpha/beta hydrolase [Blastocatellia bacterium]|nr:alpha/beta hydrolase [Blastocatellia bacterium]